MTDQPDTLTLAVEAASQTRADVERAAASRARRDEMIVKAIEEEGHSGYKVAQRTGLTEQAVARVRKRMQPTSERTDGPTT